MRFLLPLLAMCVACSSSGVDTKSGDSVDKPADPTSAPVPCQATVSGTLTGVTARVTNARCDFTLAQAAAGIEIQYEIAVASELPVFYTNDARSGQLSTPLLLSEELTGSGQSYCICDVGPRPATSKQVNVAAGTYAAKFGWAGTNWNGPSDTPQKEGAAFPAGTYTLKLHTDGTTTKPKDGTYAAAGDVDFTVTIPITLVP